MKSKRYFLVIPLVIAVIMLSGVPAGAGPAASVEPKQGEEQAMAIVNRMAEFLANAKSFSVTADIGFDAVQSSGQKIEFGETRKMVLERPNHLRVDETKRDGAQNRLIFDGKSVSYYHARENVYAIDPRAGTVDDMIEYFVNGLDMRLPLAEMMSTQLPRLLSEKIREAAFVEESSIAGIACYHLALRGDKVDLQVWVAKGSRPLPQRLVITYKQLDGRPQFWAQFIDWNLAPKITESLFAFTPPSGAVKIAFSPQQVKKLGQQRQKKGDSNEGK